jgi:hypothetical protein
MTKEELKERCERLKQGKSALIRKFLDEIAEEGLTSPDTKKGELTKINIPAKEIIEKKINKEIPTIGDNGRPLDKWGDELPF